jgi:hypothetical protein
LQETRGGSKDLILLPFLPCLLSQKRKNNNATAIKWPMIKFLFSLNLMKFVKLAANVEGVCEVAELVLLSLHLPCLVE